LRSEVYDGMMTLQAPRNVSLAQLFASARV
jgi:hypothetical protein